ncbi:MAG: hypothetical protein H0X07_12130 [Gemmatimonadales bacterium]|nr:hypothetical protein [Gemmatimonadales bacterium]
MKAQAAASLILAALAVSSCGGRKAVEISPSTVAVASRWNGTLTSPPELAGVSSIQGSGWMGPDEKNADRTQAQVNLSNAVPGGVHPWHVHRGRCGQDQGIFGPAEAYKPLKVGGDGRASSKGELPVSTPKTGEYFVQVHASAQNMKTIVACGNLAPPAR